MPDMQNIRIPRAFIPIDIGNTEDSKREAIIGQEGNLALIADRHHSVEGSTLLGKIRIDREDTQCYYFQVPKDQKSFVEKRLHYHDLISLTAGVPGSKAFGLNFKVDLDY
jgi:hypothetical protein